MNKYSKLFSKLNNNFPSKIHDSILILDGMNMYLRSFNMVNYINPNGTHIGGVAGFLNSMGSMISKFNPTRVFITFEGRNSTSSRKATYSEYKGNRDHSKIMNYKSFNNKEDEVDSLNEQLEKLISYLSNLPITLLFIDGMEADDLIYELPQSFYNESKEINIVSNDQDFLQLVNDKVNVYLPSRKEIYNKSKIEEKFQYKSSNFKLGKILLGDSSDNIPGVKGLGPNKLLKLFPELKDRNLSLKDIYDISLKNKDKHEIYSRIIEKSGWSQLKINESIIDLSKNILNEYQIERYNDLIKIENSFQLNKQSFLLKYRTDLFGNSIKNIEDWVSKFNYLDTFLKNKG